MSYGLLLLRVVVGLTMSAHGAQKLFGWFEGPKLTGVKAMLGNFGFRMPAPIALVHFKNGFWAGKGGYEFNLVLLAVAGAVAATGPGRFSIDRALGLDDNLSGLWWGVGVLGAAALLSFLTLNVARRRERLRHAPVT